MKISLRLTHALVYTAIAVAACATPTLARQRPIAPWQHHQSSATATPIHHLVVNFQENVSFDHYFATYPHAKNPGEVPRFTAASGTPSANGLNDYLLHHNPNRYNPMRLARSEALTCDQDHGYTAEQKAFDGGLMDRFVENGDQEDCSPSEYPTVSMNGDNIVNLLNDKGLTWGWFEGGFRATSRSDGKAVCGSQHANIGGVEVTDYIPHHEPFQYYQSTANPHHLPPTSPRMNGHDDQANHQYDLSDFWKAVQAGNLPAVSFLKASGYQDGHAGYSDPLDEQRFLVETVNRLQQSPQWRNTAVIIAYDASDGWYDHVMSPIVTHSSDPMHDALINHSTCANLNGEATPIKQQDRCGYGPRLPLMIISQWSRVNPAQSYWGSACRARTLAAITA